MRVLRGLVEGVGKRLALAWAEFCKLVGQLVQLVGGARSVAPAQ
jgi:hypothetical protein